MTKSDRDSIARHRKMRDESALKLAHLVERAYLTRDDESTHFGALLDAYLAAGAVTHHTRRIAEIVSDAHCFDCGEESGACSPTCGYDGPTTSDAMADS